MKDLPKKKEEEICHICFAEVPDSVLMPCCHGGICYKCGIDLWKTSDECHLCRGVRTKLFNFYRLLSKFCRLIFKKILVMDILRLLLVLSSLMGIKRTYWKIASMKLLNNNFQIFMVEFIFNQVETSFMKFNIEKVVN